MKELTRTKEVTEVYGYESDDGTYFKTAEECKKYEETARYAIDKAFFDLCVKQYDKEDGFGRFMFSECSIFENFGYGSDEWMLVVLEMKSAEDLKIVDMYRKEHLHGSLLDDSRYILTKEYIGKKVLVGIGQHYEGYDSFYVYGTVDELVEKFKNDVSKYFDPKTETEKEDENV